MLLNFRIPRRQYKCQSDRDLDDGDLKFYPIIMTWILTAIQGLATLTASLPQSQTNGKCNAN